MKIRKLSVMLLSMALLVGCAGESDTYVMQSDADLSSVTENSPSDEVSFNPIVCRYTMSPTCWTVVDCIDLIVTVRDNNTVDISYSGFNDTILEEVQDGVYLNVKVSIDDIYGQTFNITEDEKHSIIAAIEENNIAGLGECGDDESCDGSYDSISLFNAERQVIHTCGGLNPHDERFRNTVNAIHAVLPENAISDARDTAEEILKEYLLEHYPESYEWLNQE